MARLPLATVFFAVLCTLVLPARATSDGGRLPRLLAYAGERQRWAIIAFESVQEGCDSGGCTIVAVDLGAKAYRERWPHEMKPGPAGSLGLTSTELAEAYLATLPSRLGPLHGHAAQIVEPLLDRMLDGRVLALSELAETDSMRPYASVSKQPCGMEGNACSSCEQRRESVNGRPATFWRCRPEPGAFEQGGIPCHCHAKGRVVALNAKGFLSRRIHLEPWSMAQNMMNGPDVEPTTDVLLREVMLHRNVRGDRLVLAGAVHEPMANGTWHPVVAYQPGTTEAPPPAPPVVASPDDPEVTVVVPTPPPRGGCAGCTSAPAEPPQAAWILLALAARRRKAKRSRR